MNLTGSLKVVCGDYLNFLNMKICERFLNFGAEGVVAFYSLLFYHPDVSSTSGRPADTEFDIQLDIWPNIVPDTGGINTIWQNIKSISIRFLSGI